jgi:5-methyltetrahydropteroyltriglutamate--homocysteine methyltransferase
VPAEELEAIARDLRRQTWTFLRDAGLGQVPSNHFSLYDQVLDTCVLVGAVPERFIRGPRLEAPGPPRRADGLDAYFAMARGRDDVTAMEMTKWFDTNYLDRVSMEMPPNWSPLRVLSSCVR